MFNHELCTNIDWWYAYRWLMWIMQFCINIRYSVILRMFCIFCDIWWIMAYLIYLSLLYEYVWAITHFLCCLCLGWLSCCWGEPALMMFLLAKKRLRSSCSVLGEWTCDIGARVYLYACLPMMYMISYVGHDVSFMFIYTSTSIMILYCWIAVFWASLIYFFIVLWRCMIDDIWLQ